MEFGSLGLGLSSQSASSQTGASGTGQAAAAGSNPENTVTPVADGESLQNDRQQDQLGRDNTDTLGSARQTGRDADDLSITGRRTTLNFDSEQNRIFLQVIDADTEEVIEQIPSDQFVKMVRQALGTERNSEPSEDDTLSPNRTELAD